MLKLHLGCGDIRIEGFLNIDIRQTPATDKVMDISNLAEFDHNSVDMIYACSVLEHFSFRIVPDVLHEWNRVLKKGGELVLVVPDFDILVNTYLRRRSSDLPDKLNFPPEKKRLKRYLKIFVRVTRYILFGKQGDREIFPSRIKRVIELLFPLERRTLNLNLLGDFLGGQDYPENQHKAFFNAKLLRNLLSKAGFCEIRRVGSSHFPVNSQRIHYSAMCFSCWKS